MVTSRSLPVRSPLPWSFALLPAAVREKTGAGMGDLTSTWAEQGSEVVCPESGLTVRGSVAAVRMGGIAREFGLFLNPPTDSLQSEHYGKHYVQSLTRLFPFS